MDKKSQIIKETYSLFSQKGYNVSMSEIAKAVDIKTPSLYSHFKNKNEIIELTIRTEIEHYFDTIFKNTLKLKHKTCEEKLKSMLFYSIDYYKKSSRLSFWKHMSLIQNKELKDLSFSLIQKRDKYLFDLIEKCFEKGITEKEIKNTADKGSIYLYFSMMQGILTSMFFYQNNGVTIEEFTTMAWESYWNSIKF